MDYYVKELIERSKKIHESYELTRDKIYIKELADLFKIKLDESRLDDYKITNIELWYNIVSKPTLTIYDSRKDAFLNSYIIDTDELISFLYEANTSYVATIVKLPKSKCFLKQIFYINSDVPIAEVIFIKHNNYAIEFNRKSNRRLCNISTPYQKELWMDYYELEGDCHLLAKGFANIPSNNYFFESKLVNREISEGEIQYCHNLDNEIYFENGNIVYVIEASDSPYLGNTNCVGTFIEKTNELCANSTRLDSLLEVGFHIDYDMLYSPDTKSAFFFWIDHNHSRNYEIFKQNNKLVIRCCNKYFDDKKEFKIENIWFELPSITYGVITSDDIKGLVNNLYFLFYNDEMNDIFCNELLKYADMLDNRKALILEESDLLSPKRLINTSFEEILEEVGNNKDKYFDLAQKEFEEMAYGEVKKPIVKALKPSNN